MAKKNGLIPKTEQNSSGTPGLSEIGKLLREKSSFAESSNSEPKIEIDEEKKEQVQQVPPQEPKNNTTKKEVSSLKLTTVLDLMEEKDYLCKSTLYIDVELHEVLTLLKTKGKISMSKLVSYILEQFILDNKDEITQITENKNRYLSKNKK